MAYRGTCLDGPFTGIILETEKDQVPVEVTYKRWIKEDLVHTTIVTGDYVWSNYRNGFTYEKVAHVERTDKCEL